MAVCAFPAAGKQLSFCKLLLLMISVICFLLLMKSFYLQMPIHESLMKTKLFPYRKSHKKFFAAIGADCGSQTIYDKFKSLGTVELTIRMTSSKDLVQLFFCDFLRSASVFWSPLYGPLTIIVDGGDSSRDYFPGQLPRLHLPFKIRIVAEMPPKNLDGRFDKAVAHMRPRGYGYAIQLYSSFLMDIYTNASIIAWSDTDVIFTTIVTPDRIKRNGKILVKGTNSYHIGNIQSWAVMTKVFTGLANIADFMTFFPTYIYPSTIRNCRQYIMQRFNRTDFEDAFIDAVLLGPGGVIVSPVNLLYTYAFYFERHLYKFHIDLWEEKLGKYNEMYLEPGHFLTPDETTVDLDVGIHSRYTSNKYRDFEEAICHARKHDPVLSSSFCSGIVASHNLLLLKFEDRVTHSATWCKGELMASCISAIEAHERDVAEYVRHCSFRTEPIQLVEDVAKYLFGTKCQPIVIS